MTQNDSTLSRTIIEMVTIAGEYCSYIEQWSSHSQPAFLRSMKSFVPLLYLRGSLLPSIQPEFPEANERFVTEETWEGIFLGLRQLIGEQDEFTYVGLSNFHEQAMLKGSLAEHFADVYQDMKDFVLLFKKPSQASRENAVFECRAQFVTWGFKLATILPVLHSINVVPEESTFDSDTF